MMRPARSRRVLAQRKFAQGAYVPPSAAPAPPTNGDRRDNNPSARNFIIQHQVGPSVFVDYISYQALELHHKGLQPFVMVKRLEVPPSQRTRARRTELMRNRELIRNRELDKNRDIHDKKTRENLRTTTTRESTRNKETNKSKNIATNKDKNNDNTTVKDSSKKNNLRQTSVKSLKEMVKSKETPTEKDVIKKKDVTKNKLNKTKEKRNLSTNKSNREKPPPIKKPKSTKPPVHVMSLRSRRQSEPESNQKAVATRATKRLAVARRKVANALKDTTPQEKPKQKNNNALKTPKCVTPAPSEFSVDDNRPLTYFAKGSTPKRAPAAPVPRVALVPLTSATPTTAPTTSTTATTAPEPVAGPSGSNKKKVTTRSPKTNTNPYVLLPNIAPTAPAPETSNETQTNTPEPPFYSTSPNILEWMHTSFDDELGLLKVVKSTPAPWATVQPSCPAQRWHTVKELNNADKAQLEARCLRCGACMRIDKLMKISETLKSLVKFDVSGDDDASTAEPNKQEDKVSSDGTIYMELLPKMANKLMKIRTHNVHGKKILSACLIPRAHAQQTKDLSLAEQEGLLEQINATVTASTQATERSGSIVIESRSDTDSSTGEPDPKVRPTFKMKRQRRQSVCADLAMQPQPQRKRRQSVSAELASQPQEQQQKSDVAMQPRPQRQRRKSMCAELAMKEQQQLELAIKEQEKQKRALMIKEKEEEHRKYMTKRLQEQRQRELALKERQEQQRREYAQRQQQEHQRRESEKQQEQQRHESEMLRQQEQQRYMSQKAAAQRPLQNRDVAYLTMALQAGPHQGVRETKSGQKPEENVPPQPQQQNVPQQQEQRQPKSVPEVKVQPKLQRQRRQSVSAELAAKQQQQEQLQRQPKSIPEVKVQPKSQLQRRQSVSAELAAKQQQQEQRQPKSISEVKVQPQSQRQRRQSVSAELAAKEVQEQRQRELASSTTATRSPRQQQGRQTVSAESAALEQLQQQTHESVSKEKVQAQPQQRQYSPELLSMPQRRQRRQSVSVALEQLQQQTHESVSKEKVQAQPQQRQYSPELLSMPQRRQRRQSVSVALEQLQQQTHESVSKEKVQAQPQQRQYSPELSMPQRRQRRQSVSVALEQLQQQTHESVSKEKVQAQPQQRQYSPELSMPQRRQRRQSVSVALEQLQQQTHESVSKEKVQAQPQQRQYSPELSMPQRRQRRQSVSVALEQLQQQTHESVSKEKVQAQPQQRQYSPELSMPQRRQRRQSVSVGLEQLQQQTHESVSKEKVQAQPQQRQYSPELSMPQRRQRRQSVSVALEQLQQQTHESVSKEKVQAQPQQRQYSPELSMPQRRQRRQSVSVALEQLQQQTHESVSKEKVQAQPQQRQYSPELSMPQRRQRRQSVSVALEQLQQQTHESVSKEKVQAQPQQRQYSPELSMPQRRQRRQSVSVALEQLQQQTHESVSKEKVQAQPQQRQYSPELSMPQRRQRRQSVSVGLEQLQQQTHESVSKEKVQAQPQQRQYSPELSMPQPRQRRQSVSVGLEQLQQQTHESVSKEKVQAQPQQRQYSPELSMPQPRQRRESVCEKSATEDLVTEHSYARPSIAADLASIDSDMLCDLIDEATKDWDPRQIEVSTPCSMLEHDRPSDSENNEEPIYNQTGEPMAETYEFPLVNEETPLLHDIKPIFQLVGNSSQQEQVAGTSGRYSPGLIGSESSSFHLNYEDSVNGDAALEARMMAEVDEQARALEKEKDAKGDNCTDKGHSSGTDPSASSGFPNSADTAQIIDAPVFHPTMEEFEDPIAYFEKILPIAAKYGICKVVPPDGWEPECKINEDIRFDVTNQYISRLYCRWGPASRELSALKLCLQQQNVNVTRPPLVDGVEVNLPKLYHLVQRHGGLENVINKKRWGKVADEMRLNKAPVIDRKLDQLYVKYLLPYATLDHQERQEIMKKVEMAWHHKNQKLLDRATNPLHRQKRMLGESESSDGETEDEGTANALADAEDCVVPGLCMNFAKFKKVATNAYENHIGIERPDADMPSIEVIEDRYWRLVVAGTEHLCVNTAAIDTGEEGHGFTIDKNDCYGRHPWNLKMFSQNRGNVLRYLGPVLGMTVPTLHLAMIFSTSCWHKDPHALPWTEYMHNGQGRIWYGIPDDQSDNFRKAVETLAPTSCQNKCLWLPSDIAMIPPSILREHNVSLSRTVQDPNEFVLVFPKAYSCSISTGYTESESVYFAPRSWLENLEQVIKETRESCEPTMFSLEQLIILMCKDPDADVDLLKQVKPVLDKIVSEEISYRQQLEEKGLKFVTETETASKSNRKHNASAYNVRDQDECEYCRATLYLSKVRGMTGKKSSLCLEHALLLLNNPKYKEVNVGQLEVFVSMTVEELNDVTASVEARVGPSS